MAALIGLFTGAFFGNLLWPDWGAALGGIAGFFAGSKFSAWRRAQAAPRRPPSEAASQAPRLPVAGVAAPDVNAMLARRVEELERRVASLERASAPHAALGPASEEEPIVVPESPQGIAVPAAKAVDGFAAPSFDAAAPVGSESVATAAATGPASSAAPAARTTGTAPALPQSPANALRAWLTGGNALTRIGVVIVFFGVAFLLKYFAEHFTVPLEVRLAAVAVFGIAMMLIGLSFARSRPGYGLSLQGAGAGILYLTTYAAFRPYGVLPESAAVVLLIGVSALTVGLAVRNDSQPLAGLAIAGGFLAPILVGGSGGPLALFGYFAVLNAAIFALAWWRSWRALNVAGFVFTFVLGLLWGHEFYSPEHYATVQPFLALFFVFYVAIPFLNLRRGSAPPKDPVDGLLVFGVPLVGFALQSALVQQWRYGAAWSALVLAGFYAVLFVLLRKRGEPKLALLAGAHLSLAVIFATIAIPFALDNRYTAALWAVEAAGVYWLGVRQNGRFARAFALLVLVGAGIAFAISGVGGDDDPLFANAFFAGAMLIAVSGLTIARVGDRAGSGLAAGERALVPALFCWGVAWWLAAGAIELVRQLPRADEIHAVLAWVTAGVALALLCTRVLAWPRLAGAGVVLLPAIAIAAAADFHLARTTLEAYGTIVWPCAWVVQWWVLHSGEAWRARQGDARYAAVDPERVLNAAHAISAVAVTAQVAWELSEWTGRFTPAYTAWTPCAVALPAIAYLVLVARWRHSSRWPFPVRYRAYAIGAGMPIAGFLGAWFFLVNLLSPGDASPLPYLPLANPLDLTLALALCVAAAWAMRLGTFQERTLYQWIGAGIFVALNGVVIRTAHQWGDVPWRLSSLLASKPLQAALTLTWTLTALAAMAVATRRHLRILWMLGAALLAAVVAKLFLLDLGALSGLPRVVAFLGAGVLLLIIGFVSPLPPAAPEKRSVDDVPPATSGEGMPPRT